MCAGQGDTVCDNGETEETERRDDCTSTEVCVATTTKVYLTSPEPSVIGHNLFISQPIIKPLRPVDSL